MSASAKNGALEARKCSITEPPIVRLSRDSEACMAATASCRHRVTKAPACSSAPPSGVVAHSRLSPGLPSPPQWAFSEAMTTGPRPRSCLLVSRRTAGIHLLPRKIRKALHHCPVHEACAACPLVFPVATCTNRPGIAQGALSPKESPSCRITVIKAWFDDGSAMHGVGGRACFTIAP
jgi:hypothetical protein